MFANEFSDGVLTNAVGAIIAGIVLFLLPLLIFDEKKVLRRWINNLNPFFRRIAETLLLVQSFLFGRIARAVYAAALVAILLIDPWSQWVYYYGGLAMFLIFSIVAFRDEYPRLRSKSSIFSDFQNDKKWKVITGSPDFNEDHGKPAPDLLLAKHLQDATNTFIVIKDTEFERGVIECDYYLESDAILNIVALGDTRRHNWYMARYDSRDGETDSILIKDAGPGANWRHDKVGYSGGSSKRRWHRARVEFSSEGIKMFRNDELIAEVTNPQLLGKEVGMFNEVNDAHVDNFRVSKL